MASYDSLHAKDRVQYLCPDSCHRFEIRVCIVCRRGESGFYDTGGWKVVGAMDGKKLMFVLLRADGKAGNRTAYLLPFLITSSLPAPVLECTDIPSSIRRLLHPIVHSFSFYPAPLALAIPPFPAVIKQEGRLAILEAPNTTLSTSEMGGRVVNLKSIIPLPSCATSESEH